MSSMMIGEGAVFHSRQTEVSNRFKYATYFLLFNVADELELNRILKRQFRGVLSLRSQDYLHGAKDGFNQSIREFLWDQMKFKPDEVWLQTMPRIFGYAFNPVSFWILKKNSRTEAVLCEVNNTFGERHFYWVHNPGQSIENKWHSTKKMFHVSPFQPIRGSYDFRFRWSDQSASVEIFYREESGQLRLATWVKGRLHELRSRSLLSLLSRYGWMTPLVVLRIHLQAIKLWSKKVPFFRKPAPPVKELSS